MNKLRQADPEVREDLQGRIEVFDQSIRSFEKRLRAVERRLSMGASPELQTGRVFSGNFTGLYPGENAGSIASHSSIYPQVPSVSPEASIHGNSFFSDLVPSVSEGNISMQYFLRASLRIFLHFPGKIPPKCPELIIKSRA